MKKWRNNQMPSAENVSRIRDSFDLVNKYGTYNIQPTAESDDEYPAIAQGLSRSKQKERQRARDEWKSDRAEHGETNQKI